MPACADFLESRKSRLGPSKSTFNAKNSTCSFSAHISELAQYTLEKYIAARNCQKYIKPLFWHSRSSKVIEFSGNREPVYDFLLVINSNLGPISHRYWDTVTYRLKITNFSYPSHLAPLFGVTLDPLQIYGKALRFLKLESSRQPMVNIWWS